MRSRISLKFTIGPAHRVRPLVGPMAGSGRTRWLNRATLAANSQSRLKGVSDIEPSHACHSKARQPWGKFFRQEMEAR